MRLVAVCSSIFLLRGHHNKRDQICMGQFAQIDTWVVSGWKGSAGILIGVAGVGGMLWASRKKQFFSKPWYLTWKGEGNWLRDGNCFCCSNAAWIHRFVAWMFRLKVKTQYLALWILFWGSVVSFCCWLLHSFWLIVKSTILWFNPSFCCQQIQLWSYKSLCVDWICVQEIPKRAILMIGAHC